MESQMNEEIFKARTKQLALKIIELVESLPRNRTADVIRRQLLRSGTSSLLVQIIGQHAAESRKLMLYLS